MCWQLKCTHRLGSHRHTHCIHGAKEREALDIISMPLGTEQSPHALIPSRVWNPGFTHLNSVGCSLFLVQTVSNYWCTEQQPQQTLQRFSGHLPWVGSQNLFLKARSSHSSPWSEAGSKAFQTGFSYTPKEYPTSGQKHKDEYHHIAIVYYIKDSTMISPTKR